jgi:acyl carrier protein
LRTLVASRTPRRTAAKSAGGPEQANSLRQRLSGLAETDRGLVLVDLVRAQAAIVLGHDDQDAVEPDRAFKDIGFDSLTAVELRSRLARSTGLRLPPTAIFDYPTASSLAAHLLAEIAPAPVVPAQPTGGHGDVLAEFDRWEARPDEHAARAGPTLEHRLRGQTPGEFGHVGLGVAGDEVPQLGGLGTQSLLSAGREQQWYPAVFAVFVSGVTGRRYRGRLFEDHVGVGAGDAEGGHRCAARVPVFLPWQRFGEQLDRAGSPVDLGRRLVGVQGAR